MLAARLVWMLRVTGHPAALLHPGLQEGEGTDEEATSRPRRPCSPRPWPPARDWVDASGRLLPGDELRTRLAAAGVVPGASVVSGCGSGVTACHTLLVMEHVGLGDGRLWPGSWSQYAAAPHRPVELADPYA